MTATARDTAISTYRTFFTAPMGTEADRLAAEHAVNTYATEAKIPFGDAVREITRVILAGRPQDRDTEADNHRATQADLDAWYDQNL